MNISPPTQVLSIVIDPFADNKVKELERVVRELSDQIQSLLNWQRDIHRFLQYPVFTKLRFSPRPDLSSPAEGDIYYDEDDNKFKGYNGTSFDDLN